MRRNGRRCRFRGGRFLPLAGGEPSLDGGGFGNLIGGDLNLRRRAVEDGDGAFALFGIAVDVGDFGSEKEVGLAADLVGGAVVDLKSGGAATHINAQGLPGEWLLEDALAKIAGEEEGVAAVGGESGEEAELGDIEVLRFIHDYEIERVFAFLGQRASEAGENAGLGH